MVRASSKLPSKNVILLNGAILLIVAASVITAFRSSLFKPDAAACSERYPRAVRLGLERGGQPLQSSDLQAIVGGTDWNLLENTRIVSLKAGPSAHAVEFKTVASKQSSREDEGKAGVGFIWTPQAILNATGACLAYSVFVPDDFDFGAGGRLPGLIDARKVANPSKPEPVSTRIGWNDTGRLDLVVQSFEHAGGRPLGSDRHSASLVRGKWTAIEQEVVLNTPGAADGIVRVWTNGKLAFERKDVVMRKTGEPLLSGVMSEVSARPKQGMALKPGAIWVSPYELKW